MQLYRLALAALLLAVSATTANADDFPALNAVKSDFTEEAYRTAVANNELFLIDVFADWCPTCKRQQRVLNKYFEENPQSSIRVFEVNFDEQKDWVTYFKAPRQSTLILYRGEEQLWFSVAQTRERRIFNELSAHESN